jgi:AraC-like DNA-binding protein
MRLAPVPAPPLWPPLLATRGPGAASSQHAHHAMHAVLALDGGALRVRAGRRGPWREVAGVVTAPDVEHAIDAVGVEILLVFLDPESSAGERLVPRFGDAPMVTLSAAGRDALTDGVDPRALMGEAGAAWTERLVRAAGGEAAAQSPSRERPLIHPRVRRLIAHLRALPPDGDVSLGALAAAVGLSEGRLMHAFTESVGVPLRPYLLWLKLQRAAAAIVGGASLADAAHEAGFSDAAHMSRTFRRMLGMPPSMLRPRVPSRAT